MNIINAIRYTFHKAICWLGLDRMTVKASEETLTYEFVNGHVNARSRTVPTCIPIWMFVRGKKITTAGVYRCENNAKWYVHQLYSIIDLNFVSPLSQLS